MSMVMALFGIAGLLSVGFYTMKQEATLTDLKSSVNSLEKDVQSLKHSTASLCSTVIFVIYYYTPDIIA